MKKIFVIALLACFLLTGCKDDPSNVMYCPFEYINGHDKLSYDKETYIVYYRKGDWLAPYYSENGKLCRYVDGEIVEIEEEENKENTE